MSNHYSAANLKLPCDDARLDFTDLYVFPAHGDPETTVLIMNANPYTTGMSAMPPFLMKSEFHLANYLPLWSKLLEGNGYSPTEAEAAARPV